MVNLKNTADIEASLQKNSEKDPEIIASMYGCSSSMDTLTSMTSILHLQI
jgi:hypothetical protein